MQQGEFKGQQVEEVGGPCLVLGEKEQVSCLEWLGRKVQKMQNLQDGVKKWGKLILERG